MQLRRNRRVVTDGTVEKAIKRATIKRHHATVNVFG